MEDVVYHEGYPWWMIVISNLVTLAIYTCGAFIVYQVGWIWMIVYLVCIAALEFRLLRSSCTRCYYYGKACAFGRGRLCGILFRQKDREGFAYREISWKNMIPDFLVPGIPLLAGVVVLIQDFSWPVLVAVVVLVLLASAGNGAVRASLACRHCRQRELGCPAEQLFAKTSTQ